MVRDIGTEAEITSVRMNEQTSAPVSPAAGYSHVFVKSDGLYLVNDSDEEIGPFITGSVDVGARVFNSVDFVVTGSQNIAVPFNGERWDTHSFHAGSSTQLVCPADGKYLIIGNVQFESNATGYRRISINLNTNTVIARHDYEIPGDAVVDSIHISTIYNLSVGDYVELYVRQTSGGNLNVQAATNYSPEFMIQKVG